MTVEDEPADASIEARCRYRSDCFARIALPEVSEQNPVPDVQFVIVSPMCAAVPNERALEQEHSIREALPSIEGSPGLRNQDRAVTEELRAGIRHEPADMVD